MATTAIRNLSSALFPRQLDNSRPCFLLKRHTTTIPPLSRRTFAAKTVGAPLPPLSASSTTATAFVQETKPKEAVAVEEERSSGNNILACPICYEPFSLISDRVLSVDDAPRSALKCNTCKKTFSGKETHLDLTLASGAQEYGNVMPLATELFRLPVVSYLYERGWRQNFFLGGFPGPEKEFEMMKDYLKPVLGGTIVDASCASGLFSRLFAKSGLFSLVVALDYSENMLQQCYEFVRQEENFPKEKLVIVRADISRLPFVSGSIDAVHAGAAMHCWPSPSAGVAEVSRVLKPGGVFVATTFILDGPFGLVPFLRPLTQNISQFSGSQTFTSERELEDLCTACGFVDFKCSRNRRFVMFSATKPS
ncbi:hypothetical protein Tsubulata_042762 [Turnera subulata]|uniref:Methyltransferase type 11 domain-containing protein n=1 Tax=Turnera subulata TaxID=218843 RepID=A0A9Q0JCJ9_9ROSI|nr:hypothetical protein Tsubulata_042762 [Turnera subulata]